MTKISPAEAVRQFDVSKPTLYSDMNEGKLSFNFDDRKKRKLDIAELQRLYDVRKPAEEQKTFKNVKKGSHLTETNEATDYEVEILKKEIDFLKKEIEFRREEADKWQNAFEKAQETAQKVTLMLEDKTSEDGAGEWAKSIKALEARLANQEKSGKGGNVPVAQTITIDQVLQTQTYSLKRDGHVE